MIFSICWLLLSLIIRPFPSLCSFVHCSNTIKFTLSFHFFILFSFFSLLFSPTLRFLQYINVAQWQNRKKKKMSDFARNKMTKKIIIFFIQTLFFFCLISFNILCVFVLDVCSFRWPKYVYASLYVRIENQFIHFCS